MRTEVLGEMVDNALLKDIYPKLVVPAVPHNGIRFLMEEEQIDIGSKYSFCNLEEKAPVKFIEVTTEPKSEKSKKECDYFWKRKNKSYRDRAEIPS